MFTPLCNPNLDQNWLHLPTGGMGTTYNLPRTPEDFLSNMEEMDIHDGGEFLPLWLSVWWWTLTCCLVSDLIIVFV